MKKLLTASAITLVLTACGSTSDSMMDDADDNSDLQDLIEVQDVKVNLGGAMKGEDEDDGSVMGETHEDAGGDGTNSTGGDAMGTSRSVTIEATDWEFSPSTITAKQGEQVTVELKGVHGGHGLAIPGLGIDVKVAPGGSTSFNLPTDKPGTYEGFCSVPCGKGHRDMHFTVVIE